MLISKKIWMEIEDCQTSSLSNLTTFVESMEELGPAERHLAYSILTSLQDERLDLRQASDAPRAVHRLIECDVRNYDLSYVSRICAEYLLRAMAKLIPDPMVDGNASADDEKDDDGL